MHPPAIHLLRHREGVLLADGAVHQVLTVIDPASGALAFPAPGAILTSEEVVLHVPCEQPQDGGELQLLLGQGIEAAAEVQDRWLAYHGVPRTLRFGAFAIESARFNGEMVEASEVTLTNCVRAIEARMLKLLNADRARLRAACVRCSQVSVPDPVAVGVDQYGVDVRATFGVLRLFFPRIAVDAAEVERSVRDLQGAGT